MLAVVGCERPTCSMDLAHPAVAAAAAACLASGTDPSAQDTVQPAVREGQVAWEWKVVVPVGVNLGTENILFGGGC